MTTTPDRALEKTPHIVRVTHCNGAQDYHWFKTRTDAEWWLYSIPIKQKYYGEQVEMGNDPPDEPAWTIYSASLFPSRAIDNRDRLIMQ